MELAASRFQNNQIIQKPDTKQLQQFMINNLKLMTTNLYIFEGIQLKNNLKVLIYVQKSQLPNWIRNIGHLEICPKIKIFKTLSVNIVVTQYFQKNLERYITNRHTQLNLIEQEQAIDIFKDILKSYSQFKANQIYHGNLSTNCIVYENGKWKIDLIPSILKLYSNDHRYYPFGQKNQRAEIYAFGVILFRCLFGFFPFEKPKRENFTFKKYLDYLDNKNNENCTKIYYFLKVKHALTQQAIKLLQKLLSIDVNMSLQNFMQDPFFNDHSPRIQKKYSSNQQVKILSQIETKNLSKVLAAIDGYKKYKTKINNKNFLQSIKITEGEVLRFIKQQFYVSKLRLSERFYIQGQELIESRLSQGVSRQQKRVNHLHKYNLEYFNKPEVEDLQSQFPCRELIKQIKFDRQTNGNNPERQAKFLIYAYPYTIALELIKCLPKMPQDMSGKVDQAIQLLLEVSNLNYDSNQKPPLPRYYQLVQQYQSFEQIKQKYRQALNSLYKYFLSCAIRDYNSAKKQLSQNPNSTEANRLKQDGLNSYRLCWKLLESSLIVRKEGKDLDLNYIETSQRKQIQVALNALLNKFFPNKIY